MRNGLPAFIEMISPELRVDFIKMFDQILAPLRTIETSIGALFQQFRSEGISHRRKFYGIDKLPWAEWVKERMIEIYPLYVEKKGTIEGIRLMTEALIPGVKIDVEPRSLPSTPFVLDLSVLDATSSDKLWKDQWARKSLLLRLSRPKKIKWQNPVNTKALRAEFESTLRSEAPLGIEVHFSYELFGDQS